jgi:hypothetical protein
VAGRDLHAGREPLRQDPVGDFYGRLPVADRGVNLDIWCHGPMPPGMKYRTNESSIIVEFFLNME